MRRVRNGLLGRFALDADRERVHNSQVMSSALAGQIEFDGFPQTEEAGEENLFQRYLRLSRENGGLIPQTMLAHALNVSNQRVCQLMAEDRFDVHKIGAQKYVTCDSFEAFLQQERKVGRPLKKPTLKSCAQAVYAAVAG
jgi:hypothetical protein